MKQRDQVAMTGRESAAMLAGSRKMQLATINADGTAHLVTMYYVMMNGQITFWTYRSSQKARNMARDPRVTCLVEDGEHYFDLRGVQVQGVARRIEDPAAVRDIGRRVTAAMARQEPAAAGARASDPAASDPAAGASDPAAAARIPGSLDEYVERAARKRIGYAVQPRRLITWDHRKLLAGSGQQPGDATARAADSCQTGVPAAAPPRARASRAKGPVRHDRPEARMHAIVTTVEIEAGREGEASTFLTERVVPQAKAMPGFVSGYWLASGDHTQGMSVEFFESDAAADAALQARAGGPPPGAPVTVVSVRALAVTATA